MITAVFGPRDYKDFKPYQNYPHVSGVLSSYGNISKLISGGGIGVEEMALRYAAEQGIEREVIPPNIKAFGAKLAFIRRNEEIIQKAEHVICFWDGRDKFYVDVFAKVIESEKTLHVYHVE